MRILINLLWIYPCVIMTVWTILTALAGWTFKRNRPFPGFFGVHPMMMMLNPKDEMLYSRPSVASVLCFLVIGLIPMLNFIILLWVICIMVAYYATEKFSSK